MVGNGPNTVAAEEIRIKLSELCYKSIACDVTEDKKHIDLSSEPLILVCAAGLVGSTADDVAKEVAIFRAHKAAPVVIATEGEERFRAAPAVITVPRVEPELAFVLAAMVGHLFGYEAALAIDALARPLREAREVIELAVGTGAPAPDELLDGLRESLIPLAQRFSDGLRSGAYDGNLEASTAVALVGRLRDIASEAPLESYERESGRLATPAGLVDDLTSSLSRAIEELTRPVDAIKHQAKTVTVGISRSDEALLDRILVQAVLTAGAPRERLGYTTLRSLAALDPAVESVVGFTRYAVEGDPADSTATIEIVDRGGVSLSVPSRVERNPHLQGTKRRVAMERELLVARGRSDGRTVLMVPEVKGSQCTGITLVHAVFADRLSAPVARAVLQGWDRRYDRLVDWVTETEGGFRDDLLAEIPVIDLLTVPVSDLAELWRYERGGQSRPGRLALVIGVGLDLVDIERFRAVLARQPALRQRLFTGDELALAAARRDPVPALAVRFAAKEAVMKALGVGLGAFAFHDVEVLKLDSGAPELRVTGAAAVLAGERGVTDWQISLSHSVTTAGAVVSAL